MLLGNKSYVIGKPVYFSSEWRYMALPIRDLSRVSYISFLSLPPPPLLSNNDNEMRSVHDNTSWFIPSFRCIFFSVTHILYPSSVHFVSYLSSLPFKAVYLSCSLPFAVGQSRHVSLPSAVGHVGHACFAKQWSVIPALNQEGFNSHTAVSNLHDVQKMIISVICDQK